MSTLDPKALAQELLSAYDRNEAIADPPSARDPGFDLKAAYAVEAELVRLRRAGGRATVGRKVGFASKAMWRILKLETLVWAHMYDHTVRHAPGSAAVHSLAGRYAPRLEPEIVFKLKQPPPAGGDPHAILAAVEWLALGFEINDCLFPGWKFQPVDFVAAFGLHTALIVGEPRPVEPAMIAALSDQLSAFKVKLFKGDQLVEEGAGKNVLRSPVLCLAELAAATARQPESEPLAGGEIISTGTLTAPQPIAAGENWTAQVEGLDLPDLKLSLSS